MELMIENFNCPLLFGDDNLQFFSDITSHNDLNNGGDVDETDHRLANQMQGKIAHAPINNWEYNLLS